MNKYTISFNHDFEDTDDSGLLLINHSSMQAYDPDSFDQSFYELFSHRGKKANKIEFKKFISMYWTNNIIEFYE